MYLVLKFYLKVRDNKFWGDCGFGFSPLVSTWGLHKCIILKLIAIARSVTKDSMMAIINRQSLYVNEPLVLEYIADFTRGAW